MRTKQFGDKNFCRAVSRLKGVKAKEKQPDGRWLYWDISLDDIDPREIRERLVDFNKEDVLHFVNLVNCLSKKYSPGKEILIPPFDVEPQSLEEVPLDEFIAKVSKTWNKSRDVYSVVGDVLNPIDHSKEFRTFTLIYGTGKEKKNIQIKVDKHTKCERLDCDSLRNARVKVIGKMNIYSQKSEININALRIELLGISSRLQEYEKNKEELQKEGFFFSFDEQKNFTVDNLTDIGLISGISCNGKLCQGAEDFIAHLPKLFKGKNSNVLHDKFIKISNVDAIIQALQELNDEGQCQVIAIVRGGGSSDSLDCYSNPELVKAIHNSKIPVITGIGHESDKPLCDFASRRACGTPTGAAEFLKRQYYRTNAQQRAHHHAKTEYDRILASFSKDDLMLENLDLKNELQDMQQKIKQLEDEISHLKSRGFFSRIFNLG